jgi:hypothetical protein
VLEDGKATVSLSSWAHDESPVGAHRFFDELVVSQQRRAHLVPMLFPEASAALQVGKEKGECTYRQTPVVFTMPCCPMVHTTSRP